MGEEEEQTLGCAFEMMMMASKHYSTAEANRASYRICSYFCWKGQMLPGAIRFSISADAQCLVSLSARATAPICRPERDDFLLHSIGCYDTINVELLQQPS